jgi:hypothetical protein
MPSSTLMSAASSSGSPATTIAPSPGTSVKMIEAHYGALLDTAHESMLERLEGIG